MIKKITNNKLAVKSVLLVSGGYLLLQVSENIHPLLKTYYMLNSLDFYIKLKLASELLGFTVFSLGIYGIFKMFIPIVIKVVMGEIKGFRIGR